MSRLLAITPMNRTRITGRFSDGSDRQEVTETVYVAEVVDDTGRLQHLEFSTQPTDQEIRDRLEMGRELGAIRKADLEEAAGILYQTWLRWHTTRVEAVTRAAPPNLLTALQTREDAAWSAYMVLLQQWRTAV
jgi:hypothetical protein